MSASCRRCRELPASCRITDWRFQPTSYIAVAFAGAFFKSDSGLSGYLLGTCLLKTAFCCVQVSNHVPCRRVTSLASRAADRGADADVGRLCRLQRRYVDAL